MQSAESHSLTPEERFREIAKILAQGLLRLRHIPIAVPLEYCMDLNVRKSLPPSTR